jgi:hypothetical protein
MNLVGDTATVNACHCGSSLRCRPMTPRA